MVETPDFHSGAAYSDDIVFGSDKGYPNTYWNISKYFCTIFERANLLGLFFVNHVIPTSAGPSW